LRSTEPGGRRDAIEVTISSMPCWNVTKRLQRAPLVPACGARRFARQSARMIERSRRSSSENRGIVAVSDRSSGSAV